MPPPEGSLRFQNAVLWPATGIDGYGMPVIGSPVELRVRWVYERQKTVDPKGQEVGIDATVIVDRQIAIGSRMVLGTLDEWYATGSSILTSEVMEVVTYSATPDVKGRVTEREVGLKFYTTSTA